MTIEYIIYVLLDPRDRKVRYVGQTADPRTREAEHLCSLPSGGRAYGLWQKELRSLGSKPIFRVIANAFSRPQAVAVEKHWVAYFRRKGQPLVNAEHTGAYHRVDPNWRTIYHYR